MPLFGACAGTKGQTTKCGIRVVPQDRLGVSEPPPEWFGNEPNPARGTPQAKGWSNGNWLKSRFHFNFAEYSGGPSSFGVLRVMNDDLVQPARGFDTHPHRDMEILTFVVDGSLTHKDSEGNAETLGRGSIQFMTAGSGIRHSEHNWDREQPLRFIQSWVTPRQRGLRPNYGSMVGDELAAEARRDKWAHLVGDAADGAPVPVQINQDCSVFACEVSSGSAAPPLELRAGRQAYMLCVEGSLEAAGGGRMARHDAAELKGPMTLELTASAEGTLVLVFEMAETRDGRADI